MQQICNKYAPNIIKVNKWLTDKFKILEQKYHHRWRYLKQIYNKHARNMKQICNKNETNIQQICTEYNPDRLEKGKRATGRDDTACRPNLASSICSCSVGNTNTYLFVGQIHSCLSEKYKPICWTNTDTLYFWLNATIFVC